MQARAAISTAHSSTLQPTSILKCSTSSNQIIFIGAVKVIFVVKNSPIPRKMLNDYSLNLIRRGHFN